MARELICGTGRELLNTGLVARTWGNVSCRLDEKHFLITPSGLDYLKTTPEDIACVELNGLYESPRRGQIFYQSASDGHEHRSAHSADVLR